MGLSSARSHRAVGGTLAALTTIAAAALSATPAAASSAGTIDNPGVSSHEYPSPGPADGSGGSGVPGTFTFTANGVTDATGYDYYVRNSNGDSPTTYVAANHEGGPAKVEITPDQTYYNDLLVTSVDAAGNQSATTDYAFQVADNAPKVTCRPQTPYLGQAANCTFAPHKGSSVVGYQYQLGYEIGGVEPVATVAAGADGKATITVEPSGDSSAYFSLYVQSELSNGNLSSKSNGGELYLTPPPTIAQSTTNSLFGMPVTFTFRSELPGSTYFSYYWELEDGPIYTVPVGPDGTATVTMVPDESGTVTLVVQSHITNSMTSWGAQASVQVASNGSAIPTTGRR